MVKTTEHSAPPDVSELVPSDYSFDLFVSYRRRDGERAAHWLRRRLLGARLPPAVIESYR